MRSNSRDVQPMSGLTRRLRVVPSSEFRVPSSSRAFTLVEMLVVIAIIGILAALITPAIYQAMWAARQTRIKTELDQLASGIEAIKAKYGSYPPANLTCPSNSANAALTAFVAKAFPRYTLSSQPSLAQQIWFDLNKNGVDTTNFNPQAALVFWLAGFNPDVTDPFNRNLIPVTRSPFFTFDFTRVLVASTGAVAQLTGSSGAGGLIYNAPYGNTAYAYFDYQNYGTLPTLPAAYNSNGGSIGALYAIDTQAPSPGTSSTSTSVTNPNLSTLLSSGTGYLMPYIADSNNNGTIDLGEGFAKPQSFQIISAGQDGAFGSALGAGMNYRLFPTGVGYDSAGTDGDNITNFSEKSSLDAAKP